MEWRVFLKKGNKTYRAFKIRQDSNLDIIFIPKSSVHITQELLDSYEVGDRLELSIEADLSRVDHYSAHSKTGQRHVKSTDREFAINPFLGTPFKNGMTIPMPLLTYIAVLTPETEETPSKKWYGYNLEEDVNYCIFDIFVIPTSSDFQCTQNFRIENTKKSRESIDHKIIPSRNCDVVISCRSSTHNKATLKQSVLFQQNEGKSALISRVEDNLIHLEIIEINTGLI